jgi:hypothetical protein
MLNRTFAVFWLLSVLWVASFVCFISLIGPLIVGAGHTAHTGANMISVFGATNLCARLLCTPLAAANTRMNATLNMGVGAVVLGCVCRSYLRRCIRTQCGYTAGGVVAQLVAFCTRLHASRHRPRTVRGIYSRRTHGRIRHDSSASHDWGHEFPSGHLPYAGAGGGRYVRVLVRPHFEGIIERNYSLPAVFYLYAAMSTAAGLGFIIMSICMRHSLRQHADDMQVNTHISDPN